MTAILKYGRGDGRVHGIPQQQLVSRFSSRMLYNKLLKTNQKVVSKILLDSLVQNGSTVGPTPRM
jgi:hypothetical protein